jgi:hypothetical protein
MMATARARARRRRRRARAFGSRLRSRSGTSGSSRRGTAPLPPPAAPAPARAHARDSARAYHAASAQARDVPPGGTNFRLIPAPRTTPARAADAVTLYTTGARVARHCAAARASPAGAQVICAPLPAAAASTATAATALCRILSRELLPRCHERRSARPRVAVPVVRGPRGEATSTGLLRRRRRQRAQGARTTAHGPTCSAAVHATAARAGAVRRCGCPRPRRRPAHRRPPARGHSKRHMTMWWRPRGRSSARGRRRLHRRLKCVPLCCQCGRIHVSSQRGGITQPYHNFSHSRTHARMHAPGHM